MCPNGSRSILTRTHSSSVTVSITGSGAEGHSRWLRLVLASQPNTTFRKRDTHNPACLPACLWHKDTLQDWGFCGCVSESPRAGQVCYWDHPCCFDCAGRQQQFLMLAWVKPKQSPKSYIFPYFNECTHQFIPLLLLITLCRFWSLPASVKTHLVTLICSPAQIYQLHFDLDPDKWRLSRVEWMCESVSTANQHVIVSCVMRRGNSPNHNPHSLHASGNVCQVSSSSLCVPPPRHPALFLSVIHIFSSCYFMYTDQAWLVEH